MDGNWLNTDLPPAPAAGESRAREPAEDGSAGKRRRRKRTAGGEAHNQDGDEGEKKSQPQEQPTSAEPAHKIDSFA